MSENAVEPPANPNFHHFVLERLCPAIRQVVDESYLGAKAPVALYAAILMIYTEVLGQALLGTLGDHDKGKAAAEGGFRKFFGEMGAPYREFRKSWDNKAGHSMYDAFRNGLVHQLAPKVPTTIHFKNDEGLIRAHGRPDLTISKPVECGIGNISDGHYFIVIERYLDDFEAACNRLFAGSVPPSDTPHDGGLSRSGSDSDEAPFMPGFRWITPGTSSPDTSQSYSTGHSALGRPTTR